VSGVGPPAEGVARAVDSSGTGGTREWTPGTRRSRTWTDEGIDVTDASRRGIRSAQIAILVNAGLAITKLVAGLVGHTYALVADAVESTADIFSSTVVWGGLRVA
jgi:Co/Zn/Cd efflux system component